MSNLEKANRRLRRASAVLGFMATVELAFYWAVGLGACAFILLILIGIARA